METASKIIEQWSDDFVKLKEGYSLPMNKQWAILAAFLYSIFESRNADGLYPEFLSFLHFDFCVKKFCDDDEQ